MTIKTGKSKIKEQRLFNINLNSDCLGKNIKPGFDTELVRCLLLEGKIWNNSQSCIWLEKIIFKVDMLIAHLRADVNNSMKLITLMSKKTVANGKTLEEQSKQYK